MRARIMRAGLEDLLEKTSRTFALSIPDGASTLIATNCQIDGPIGQGVQVVND